MARGIHPRSNVQKSANVNPEGRGNSLNSLWRNLVIIFGIPVGGPSNPTVSKTRRCFLGTRLAIPLKFIRAYISVRMEVCPFPDLRARTVFVVAILPWVARSHDPLRFDNVFTRDRLPRANHVYPHRGFDPGRIL